MTRLRFRLGLDLQTESGGSLDLCSRSQKKGNADAIRPGQIAQEEARRMQLVAAGGMLVPVTFLVHSGVMTWQYPAKIAQGDEKRVAQKKRERKMMDRSQTDVKFNKGKTGVEFQYGVQQFILPRRALTLNVDVGALTDTLSEKMFRKYQNFMADKYFEASKLV